MAKVHVCNVVVLDNPSPFLNPFQFEITFECIEDLQEDLEWRIIYVGSAECEELDQVLDTVYVGPVSEGRHMFVFQAEPPDPLKIPVTDVVGVTVVLLTCSYRGQEFMRVGYYVNNDYKEPELRKNPPACPLFDKIHRNLLATNPHVTSFKIDWDDAESQKDSLTSDGDIAGSQDAIVGGQTAIQGKWDGSSSQLKASQNSKGPSKSLLGLGSIMKVPDMDVNRGEYCLPKKPEEPSQADCCGSGCSYCVFDVYQRELAKWEKDCEKLLKGEKPSKVNETLSQLEFKSFPLIRVTPSAEQLNVYRFSVPEESRLDIKPGQHLMMKGFTINKCDTEEDDESDIEDQSVIMTTKRSNLLQEQASGETFLKRKYLSRAYTILNNQPGYFEILIKVYSDGKMSQYVRTLDVGDCVLWRGPFGDYCHNPSNSSCSTNGGETVLAICAGTGIAPVYPISKSIVSDEDDETRIRLLWANHSWNYLPLVQEMKELTSYWNFSCRLFFSQSGDVPPGSNTFFEVTNSKINFQVLEEELESIPVTNVKVLLCGSLSFEEEMLAFLNKLGLQRSSCHRFQ